MERKAFKKRDAVNFKNLIVPIGMFWTNAYSAVHARDLAQELSTGVDG